MGEPVLKDARIAANTCPIAFGNFKLGYVIIDKIGMRLLRDPFTSKPNVLFYLQAGIY